MTAEEEAGSFDNQLKAVDDELSSISSQIRALQRRKAALEKKKADIEDSIRRKENEALESKNWEAETFPWSSDLRGCLSSTFGLSSFRPLQLSAMNALLSGHDVYLVMPTGGGKSLCFQLPAVAVRGLTVVVSPLVALMEDQVMALKRVGVRAEMLNADTPRDRVTDILNSMTDVNSDLKLLYVTPEKVAKSKRLLTKLQASFKCGRLSRVAIDEVHCCSQWGHDFRTDYKFLVVFKRAVGDVPIIGLTATSTSQVTEDCQKMLGLEKCIVFKAPFNRPNLYYEVRLKPETQEECVTELANLISTEFAGQSGIIYTLSIKDANTLAETLKGRGLKVAPYHAMLESSTRSRIHQKWLSGEYQAVAATVAFGMGIDKPDVRFVIHHCVAKSMENFYQESGRAGRDDRPARCIAYYRLADVFRISTMVFTERTGLEKLYAMLAYCVSFRRCRRSVIAEHFGEEWDAWPSSPSADCCDVCSRASPGKPLCCADEVADAAVQLVDNAEFKFDAKLTGLKLTMALLGKGEAKFRLPEWEKGKELDKLDVEYAIANLLLEGFLKEDFAFTPYTTHSYLVRGPRSLGVPAGQLSVGPIWVPSLLQPPNPKKSKKRQSEQGDRQGSVKKTKERKTVDRSLLDIICLSD